MTEQEKRLTFCPSHGPTSLLPFPPRPPCLRVKTSLPSSPQPWLRPELIAPWPKLIVIILLMGGEPALASAQAALHGSSNTYHLLYSSNGWLIHNILFESTILALVLAFLYWRGWRPADFRIKMSWAGAGQGVFLWFAMKVGYSLVILAAIGLSWLFSHFAFAHGWHGAPPIHSLHGAAPNPLLFLFFCVLNAYFEEIIAMAYIFNQLAAKSAPLLALLLTVALRMSCHTYQGLLHMVAAGAIFFVAGTWYWRTRNLWPVIFAHALFDIFPLNLLRLL